MTGSYLCFKTLTLVFKNLQIMFKGCFSKIFEIQICRLTLCNSVMWTHSGLCWWYLVVHRYFAHYSSKTWMLFMSSCCCFQTFLFFTTVVFELLCFFYLFISLQLEWKRLHPGRPHRRGLHVIHRGDGGQEKYSPPAAIRTPQDVLRRWRTHDVSRLRWSGGRDCELWNKSVIT